MEKVSPILNGAFTIQSPRGSHRTFEIKTKAADSKFAPGERVLSLLAGPDNTRDYRSFGFVKDDGIRVFRKYRGDGNKQSDYEWFARMLWSLATRGEQSALYKRGYRLLQSNTCIRCNRRLTTPESISRGLGAECAKRTNS